MEELIDNNIYLYAEIDTEIGLEVGIRLRELDVILTTQSKKLNIPPIPIIIHIQSYGGGVVECFALVDIIKKLESPTISVVEGVCASGATLIAMACTHRFITPRSYFLIHQLSNDFDGTYNDHSDNNRKLKHMMQLIVEFYLEHSTMTRKQINKLIKRNKWLTAAQTLKKGIVDELYI